MRATWSRKGDLGNLLLTFPDLAAEDFRPWVDEDAARRQGMDREAFAAADRDSGSRLPVGAPRASPLLTSRCDCRGDVTRCGASGKHGAN